MMTQSDLDREALFGRDPADRVRCNLCDYEIWEGQIVVEPHPECKHEEGFMDGNWDSVPEPEIVL